jgi:hypothetical protein
MAILLLAALLDAEAQEARKVPRIGVLHTVPPSTSFQAFRKGLWELGYIHLDYRWPESGPAGLQALAAEFVQSRFDVIVPNLKIE